FSQAAGQGVIPAVLGAGDSSAGFECVVGAVADIAPCAQRPVLAPFLGDDVHDAPNRVGTVQAAGGAAHDFNAFYRGRIDCVPVCHAGDHAVDANSVDQDQGMARLIASQHHAGGGLRAAIAVELDSRLLGQYFRYAVLALFLKVFLLDDGDIANDILFQLRHAAGSHDDVVEPGYGSGGLGHGGQRKKTGKNGKCLPV